MIRKSSLTHASELLVDMSNNERRAWVTSARESFITYVSENCMDQLMACALFKDITIRAWTYARCDEFLAKTDAGRAFVERVEGEART